ncbi:MAG: phosphatase PAP2 family protein [Alphaproteobacteria bacterium]|nr:phosphatase PAP2 family protein [Alphaproteobacteria bacterium]
MFIRQNNTLKWKWIFVGALITALLVFAGVFGVDKYLYQIFHRMDCNVWTESKNFLCSIAIVFDKLFSAKTWLIVSFASVVVFFMYKAIKNENDFRYAFVKIKNSYVFYVFCSVVCAVVVTGILKFLIGRGRPLLFDALGSTEFVFLSSDYSFHSMPSGHSAASFAGLVMLGMLFPRMKWFTWTLAIIIGFSRIYVGAHWPSDVLLGAFIGMICADVTKSVLKKINSK